MGIKDFDISFKRITSTGGIGIKDNREAITQAIRHVLLTRKGEKLFDPNFGGSLGDYTDGSVSKLDSLSIKDDIYYALTNEMKDIIIINKSDITVKANKKNNKYDISIDYKKVETEQTETISFSLTMT